MKKFLLIMLILIPALVVGQETVKYDYMTIVQRYRTIKISTREKFEVIGIKEEKEDEYDFRPILKRVEDFELKNWEVLELDVSNSEEHTADFMAVIMRREKESVGDEGE